MNESQLRGWRPRQPSAGLKARVFRDQPAAALPATRWNWHHLAPAMACLFFVLMMFHFNGGGALRDNCPAVYVNFTGDSNVVTFSDRAQETENHLAAVTFDWTNHGDFKSSMRSRVGFGPSTNLSN
jgi:hypothetical protein